MTHTLKALSLGIGLMTALPAAASGITVHKSPTCGCCTEWVEHLRENGFDVTVNDTRNLNAVKIEAGLTRALASCHTAFVGDYVIEGHVPAADIRRLLDEAPEAHGLAVPGMPIGSPGMEVGDRQDAYAVLLFNESGQSRVFTQYP
ncbi:DUF411 domain-containing protein [Tamilnaduibacter salinus]|uniref:DUF411 domain-containing protein n=1 Tax=Tamilnaduibacter salinus TaxID=1484056 RepID=UPI001B80DEBE